MSQYHSRWAAIWLTCLGWALSNNKQYTLSRLSGKVTLDEKHLAVEPELLLEMHKDVGNRKEISTNGKKEMTQS